jgi:hypothetical protein
MDFFTMRFDMKQVRKHERLINMAALSVIVFAFTSSIIMVGWFIKQPHITAESPSLEARHKGEPSLEKSEPHLPAEELPPATGVILI